MSRERINAASAATAASERAIESVTNLLKRERPVNAFGVYMDPKSVMADLAAASRDISAAATAIVNTTVADEWPKPADYEAV